MNTWVSADPTTREGVTTAAEEEDVGMIEEGTIETTGTIAAMIITGTGITAVTIEIGTIVEMTGTTVIVARLHLHVAVVVVVVGMEGTRPAGRVILLIAPHVLLVPEGMRIRRMPQGGKYSSMKQPGKSQPRQA